MGIRKYVEIKLDHIEENLLLTIDARAEDTLFEESDAERNGEAYVQLIEGFTYDYEFNNKAYSFDKNKVVQQHSRKSYRGLISPNIYTGTLTLPIFRNDVEVSRVYLEVRSIKADYRDDYRDMLEFITEKCTDLLMQASSPVSHNFEPEYSNEEEKQRALYQRFAFINSVLSTDEFSESVHRVVSDPVTQWKETIEEKDIRSIRRFRSRNIRELIKGSNRSHLPKCHFLKNYGLDSYPNKITSIRKTDTVDTSENRFVKFALESFLQFCTNISNVAKENSSLKKESEILTGRLESYLQHSVFKEISYPDTLKLNSPVLQRKEGYREILRVWLMFDLAAKLIWNGGDDVYRGGKKDIATLYEYWLFFKLLDLFQELFSVEAKEVDSLIKETDSGLNLQLKQGKYTALSGVFDTGKRKFNIRFNYNRSFEGGKGYHQSGSWTTTMRPDYTLSLWPDGIKENEAEEQDLIVHIHFDAKYKVANLKGLLNGNTEDIHVEKENNRKGIYKNADLLKMHAYKDAIRRTGGAYILYPGDKPINRKGFHEIIPGLGAFPVSPSKTNEGISQLKSFIQEVIKHFENRASQREKVAYRAYDVYKDKPQESYELNESLPEAYGDNRSLIPDDTFVLVGFYKQDKFDWIEKNGLYNLRTGSKNGSLRLSPEVTGVKYLLLHSSGTTETDKLYKIIDNGPRIFSKQDMKDKAYPSESIKDYYLVYKISPVEDEEFSNCIWDLAKLKGYKSGYASGLPFTVSLSELMRNVVKV
ncbi:MAG: DUF2357 domain-containing protein [Hyphomicrobiales bacterium]